MGYLLAGALTGLGQGLVKQAEAKAANAESARDRDFKVALENLRAKNDMTQAQTTAALNDENTRKEYGYKDDYAAKDLPRQITLKKAEGEVQKDVDGARTANDIRLTQVKGAIDRQNDAASKRLDQQLKSGEVVDTLLDETGEYVGITRTGKQIRTGVKANAVDTTIRTAGGGGSALFPELAPEAAPAPAKPAAAPAPKAQAPVKSSGPYRAKNDLDAEMFASNPANKGKVFIGPDGKQYTVK